MCAKANARRLPLLYKTRIVEDGAGDEGGDDKVLRFLKSYAVFNADQIDGLPENYRPASPAEPVTALSAEVESIKARFPVPVTYGGDRACYCWLTDRITMPHRASFDSDVDFIATLLHEFAHATGAKSRLDRFPTSDCRNDYAREELVAELASHLMSLQLGVNPSQSVFRNHVAYIEYWASFLKDRPAELLKAAGKAQAATDYILAYAKPEAEVLVGAAGLRRQVPPLVLLDRPDFGRLLNPVGIDLAFEAHPCRQRNPAAALHVLPVHRETDAPVNLCWISPDDLRDVVTGHYDDVIRYCHVCPRKR